MLDAYTAYENAMEIINMNMEREIDEVLKVIKLTSDKGGLCVFYDELYPITVKKLKQLGYKVSNHSWRSFISWEKPKKVKNNETI